MGAYSDVSKERAALMRSQRFKITLQTARLRAELVQRAQIGEVWCRLVGNSRARLLGVGSKLAGGLRGQHDAAVIKDRIDAEIIEALAELSSEGNFAKFMAELGRLPRFGADGADDMDAPAKANGKRMGRRKPKAKPGGVSGAGPVADEPS